MTHNIDDLADTLEEIDNEDRCVHLIGHAIHQAFCRDRDFRAALRPLIAYFEQRSTATVATKALHFQDLLNKHLASAYHAASAAENLHATARSYYDDHYQINALSMVKHSFGPSVIFELNSAQKILTNSKVRNAIGNVSYKDIIRVFARHFPRLNEARDALAHKDERALGKVEKKWFDGPNLHEGLQIYGQSGGKLFGLKDEEFRDFDIGIESSAIVSLISDLKILFEIK